MKGLLKPAPAIPRLPPDEIDHAYRRQRRQVFLGSFAGYAAYYLVRNNLALAIPDILKAYPQYGTGVGWIADHYGWTGVFLTMVACCLLTMGFVAMTLGHTVESEAR